MGNQTEGPKRTLAASTPPTHCSQLYIKDETDRLTDNDLRDITQCSHHTFSLDHEFYSATENVFFGDAWALRPAEIGISGSLNRSDPL